MKEVLVFLIALQAAMISFICFDELEFYVPFGRQAVTFIYLMVAPGLLVLGILKLLKISIEELILYTIGLSVSLIVLMGLLVNSIAPIIGITNPISKFPLTIAISIFVCCLAGVFYLHNRNYKWTVSINLGYILSPSALALMLIPFLAVFGAYLAYFYETNILLLFLLGVLAVLPVFVVVFDRFPEKLYPLAIFIIALSLTYHITLASPYSLRSDNNHEHYAISSTLMDTLWNPSVPDANNAMLTLVVFASIFSILGNVDIILVLKLIYPFLLSLVPLSLYIILRSQVPPKIAFMSCYFLMSVRPFYEILTTHAKMSTAIFFIALLTLLILDRKILQLKKKLMYILFTFSLVTSHYASSYIFMFYLIFTYISLLLTRHRIRSTEVTSTSVAMFVSMTIAWYMYTATGSPFNAAVRLGNHIVNSIYSELFSPEVTGGLMYLTMEVPYPSYLILKWLHTITQVFIVVGLMTFVYAKISRKEMKEVKFQTEYFMFAIISVLILGASIIIPHLVGPYSIGMDRIYSFTLLFLSPFGIVGGIIIAEGLSKFGSLMKISALQNRKLSLTILSVFFSIFLLFNSGFVTEITRDHFGSVAISRSRIEKSGTIKEKLSLQNNQGFFPEEDIFSAKWLYKNGDFSRSLYGDAYAHIVLMVYAHLSDVNILTPDTVILQGSYVYLRKINYRDNIMAFPGGYYGKEYLKKYGDYWWNTSDIMYILNSMNKIYSNGGSIIYYNG
jgi:uncharacterized membrane protein